MTTHILARYDATNNRAIVFLADSINDSEITAWSNGKRFKTTLDHYHQTLPLSQADNIALRNQFANATKDNDVVLRDRLPRKNRKLPNLIATPQQVATLKLAQSMPGAPAIAPTPTPPRKRQRKEVPNRLSIVPVSVPVEASHQDAPAPEQPKPQSAVITVDNFTFDVGAVVASLERDLEATKGKLDAVKRAAGLN